MEIVKFRGFVQEWDDEGVTGLMIIDEETNYTELRTFKLHMFALYDLYEGMNFLIEIETGGGTSTCRCLESSEAKFQQILNWIEIKDKEEDV